MNDEMLIVLAQHEVGARPREVGMEQELRVGNDQCVGRGMRLGGIDIDVRMMKMRRVPLRSIRGPKLTCVIQRPTKNG